MTDLSMGPRRSSALRRRRTQRSRSTFIVEAMLLLLCLLIVLAACMSLFAFAWQEGSRTAYEQRAIIVAQNVAERFAIDPFSVEASEEADGLQVSTQVDWQARSNGRMGYATITVSNGGEPLFELNTARYVSDAAAGAEVSS